MIEIIRIALIAVLQLMEKVQEPKCEHCQRPINSCREPVSAEELGMVWNPGPHIATLAVANDDTGNTRKVKHQQVIEA